MYSHNLLDHTPFVKRLLTDDCLTVGAQVLYLCLIRVAYIAHILKEDVDDEIFWDDLVLVLTDVFWTKLHLTSLDVVAPLNKSSVEHDSEHDLVRESSVFEDDLNIPLNHHTLFLLLCQQKHCTWLLLAVELRGRVGELLSDVQATTAVYLKEGNTSATGKVWLTGELDASYTLGCR